MTIDLNGGKPYHVMMLSLNRAVRLHSTAKLLMFFDDEDRLCISKGEYRIESDEIERFARVIPEKWETFEGYDGNRAAFQEWKRLVKRYYHEEDVRANAENFLVDIDSDDVTEEQWQTVTDLYEKFLRNSEDWWSCLECAFEEAGIE